MIQKITVTLVFELAENPLSDDEPFDHDTLDWLQVHAELKSISAETAQS